MHPCISSTLPLRYQLPPQALSSSYFSFTLCLYSVATPSLHFHHLIVLRPTILFGFVLFMRTTNTTGLCCVVVCSPVIALPSLIFHSCSFLTNTESSSVLWCPLLYVILWLSRFWKNEPTKAKPFLAISSTRAWPSLGPTYKEKSLILTLYKAIVRPHLEYCIQAWNPYLRKDIDMLEKIQRRVTKLIPGLRDQKYEERLKECGLTTLETRRLRGDQIEVFKILNYYENIDYNIFFRN